MAQTQNLRLLLAGPTALAILPHGLNLSVVLRAALGGDFTAPLSEHGRCRGYLGHANILETLAVICQGPSQTEKAK